MPTIEDFIYLERKNMFSRPHHTRLRSALSNLDLIINSEEFKKAVGDQVIYVQGQYGTNEKSIYDALGETLQDLEDAGALRDEKRRIECLANAYHMLPKLLKTKDDKGVTIYDKMKAAAPHAGIAGVDLKDLYDDLYFMDETMSIEDEKWLDMPKFDPESRHKKTKIEGEKSWKNYVDAHLADPPHDRKGREEYLSKAMAAAFRDYQNIHSPKSGVKFSVKKAREDAEYLRKSPAFKSLCNDFSRVQDLMKKGANNNKELAEAAIQIYRPFYLTSEADRV